MTANWPSDVQLALDVDNARHDERHEHQQYALSSNGFASLTRDREIWVTQTWISVRGGQTNIGCSVEAFGNYQAVPLSTSQLYLFVDYASNVCQFLADQDGAVMHKPNPNHNNDQEPNDYHSMMAPGPMHPDGRPGPMHPDGRPGPMRDGRPGPMRPDGRPDPMHPDGRPMNGPHHHKHHPDRPRFSMDSLPYGSSSSYSSFDTEEISALSITGVFALATLLCCCLCNIQLCRVGRRMSKSASIKSSNFTQMIPSTPQMYYYPVPFASTAANAETEMMPFPASQQQPQQPQQQFAPVPSYPIVASSAIDV
jgi:hypothetical protein